MLDTTRHAAMERNLTPGGKELGIYQVKGTSLYGIHFKGGGELPEELESRFTAPHLAKDAIKGYLTSRWNEYEASQSKADAKTDKTKAA